MVVRMTRRTILSPAQVESFLDDLFAHDLHAKRVRSLSDATVGVLHAGALGVHCIGRGLAAARGLLDKHAVKQVDRLLSNQGIVVEDLFPTWVAHVLGERAEVFANMDWTDFDKDRQSMLVISMQTDKGRSTPLVWKTVEKAEIKGRRNDIEDELLTTLRAALPAGVAMTIVADRGFGDHKLYRFLEELGFGYLIRFRGSIMVTSSSGETRRADEWMGSGGRAKLLRDATVTKERYPVPTVLCAKDKGMKDPWCLVSSDAKATTAELKRRYGRRFSIEEMFRDVKDWRFGMGMSWHRVGRPDRRDRVFLIAALAQGLLTLLGEAGEAAGLDRMLKTNTSKTRTLSLFRQGLMWYERLPMMPEDRARLLMSHFDRLIAGHPVYSNVLAGK